MLFRISIVPFTEELVSSRVAFRVRLNYIHEWKGIILTFRIHNSPGGWERRRQMHNGIHAFNSLVVGAVLKLFNLPIHLKLAIHNQHVLTLVLSPTRTISNLSLYDSNSFFGCTPFSCARTVPRTENPASNRARMTHTAMNPFAPLTRTLPPDAIVGILGKAGLDNGFV